MRGRGRKSGRQTTNEQHDPAAMQKLELKPCAERHISRSPQPPKREQQRQSTLTQLDFVPSSFSRSHAGLEFSDDEDVTARPQKRQRPVSRLQSKKRRKDTLTQIHGFTLSSSHRIDISSDEEDLTVPGTLDLQSQTGHNVQVESACGPNARIADSPSSRGQSQTPLEAVKVVRESPANNKTTSIIPRTPQKGRFSDVYEIPCSVSPSTGSLSTQRAVRFRDVDRSPLRECNNNGGVGATVQEVILRTPSKPKPWRAIPSTRIEQCEPVVSITNDNDAGDGSVEVEVDEQLEKDILGDDVLDKSHPANETSSQVAHSRPPMSLRRTPRARETMRKTPRKLGLRTPPDSGNTRANVSAKCPPSSPPASSEPVRIPATAILAANDHIDASQPARPTPRVKLQRATTIQDSDEDEIDAADDLVDAATVSSRSEPDFDFDLAQNTYDPVNDALERDAARFRWTQAVDSTSIKDGKESVGQTLRTRVSIAEDAETVPNSQPLSLSSAILQPSLRGLQRGKAKPASRSTDVQDFSTPSSPPLRPSQVTTVVPTQLSQTQMPPSSHLGYDMASQEPGIDVDVCIISSSPVPVLRDTSHGNVSDSGTHFDTAPSSPFALPPTWSDCREESTREYRTDMAAKGITQRLQSLADYSIPALPMWSSQMEESEL